MKNDSPVSGAPYGEGWQLAAKVRIRLEHRELLKDFALVMGWIAATVAVAVTLAGYGLTPGH